MTRGLRHEFGKKTVLRSQSLTVEPAQTADAPAADDAISTIDAPAADGVNSGSGSPGNLAGRSLNGSPLPVGSAGRPKDAPPPPGRSLAEPDEPESDPSGGQRALNILKQALPLIQKLLPLIDGNIAMALGNLLAPRPQSHAQVDLTPLESQVNRMQAMNQNLHQDLRSHIAEHNTSLKRVEDQLEMVKEASDRNTLEQQEMMEDLRAIGSRVNLFAAILFGLLIISLLLNLFLFMHIRQVLP